MTQRPVLYLLPGLLCDGSIFSHQREGLADICDVRSPHFLGLDSIEAMAQRVFDEAPERFALAGFSMGGRVALQMMQMAPERIERLCLFDTGVKPEPPSGAQKRKVLVDLAYQKGMAALAAVWLPGMLAPAHRIETAITGPLIQMICRASPEDHEKQIKALLERPDPRPTLATIQCPTLIVCGALDEWSTPAQHRDIANAIKGAELLVIEGAGHFVSVEQTEAFTQALRQFMGG